MADGTDSTSGGCHRARVPAAATAVTVLTAAVVVWLLWNRGPPRSFPLERAWQLAAAITADDKDRAASQERVAMAYLERGDSRRAVALGRQIGNWRRGVVLAEAAAWLALHGRAVASAARLDEARAFARTVTDWPADRVRLHIARAEACLGREGDVAGTTAAYAGQREDSGRVAATRALAAARAGRPSEALAAFAAAAVSNSFESAAWRVEGYLQLHAHAAWPHAQATQLLARAWEASLTVPGWRRWELQLDVAEAWRQVGDAAAARAKLESITGELQAVPLAGHVRVPLLGRTACGWARLGERARIAALEAAAEPLIQSDLQNIEQPAALARFGEAWALAGDGARAEQSFARALGIAASLVNPRPRALAGVDVCLALARGGFASPGISEALDRILDTFHDTTP